MLDSPNEPLKNSIKFISMCKLNELLYYILYIILVGGFNPEKY